MSNEKQEYEMGTLCLHAARRDGSGAIVAPISVTVAHEPQSLTQHGPYVYSRVSNPTRGRLEETIARLEDGTEGFAYATGQAAEEAVVGALRHHPYRPPVGEILHTHIIVHDDIYGGTRRLFNSYENTPGFQVSYVDMRQEGVIAAAVCPATKLVMCETPTNPFVNILDLRRISDETDSVAAENGQTIWKVVDSTLAPPVLQRPLQHGFDGSLHSATKYINGHGDLLAGLISARSGTFSTILRTLQKTVGNVLGAFECFLVERGIKTLDVRMERICENASAIAAYLADHTRAQRVYYPGLPDHPQHELAKRQMNGRFGGVVSVKFNATSAELDAIIARLELFPLAEGFGHFESEINHTATMSHGSLTDEQRAAAGITHNLIRFSVGGENKKDLLECLKRALAL
jgi:cystathionine gamma-lyase